MSDMNLVMSSGAEKELRSIPLEERAQFLKTIQDIRDLSLDCSIC